MKTISKQVLFLSLLIVSFGTIIGIPGQSDASDCKNYGMVNVGADIPTGSLDDVGYNPGLTSSITYGRVLSDNLAIEGTAGFFLSDENFSGTTATA